jgi:hypothetical protein
VVVAIDLGSTYSGYAFAFKHHKRKIYYHRNFNGFQSSETYKTPTSVLTGLHDEFVAFGYDAIAKYSDIVDAGKIGYNLFEHFKMNLHKTSNWDDWK